MLLILVKVDVFVIYFDRLFRGVQVEVTYEYYTCAFGEGNLI